MKIALNMLLLVSLLIQPFTGKAVVADSRLTSSQPPVVGYNDETGMVSFIGTKDGAPIQVSGADNPSLLVADRAQVILSHYGPMFGLTNPQAELALLEQDRVSLNQEFFRYQQVYKGIPILGGEMIVNMTSRGGLLSISGEISPALSINVTSELSASEARNEALELAVARYGIPASELTISEPALWIYDARLLESSTRPAELVWRMEVRAEQAPLNLLVLVNALHGGISLAFNQVDTSWAALAPSSVSVSSLEATSFPNPTPAPAAAEPSHENQESGGTWYVTTTGSDSNNCQAPASPCATINGAIGKAAAGDTILVAGGTYTGIGSNVVTIDKNLALIGGWDSLFELQNTYSIVDGENNRRGILILSGSVTIDHFDIRNGDGYDASGSPPYSNNGGGIWTDTDTTFIIKNSTIHHNTGYNGGGIYATYVTSLQIVNSTVGDNTGRLSGYGGGVYSTLPDEVVLKNTTIFNNTGGGFYRDGVNAVVFVQNSIMAGNKGRDCTGKIVSNGYNLIQNKTGCTFTLATGDITGVSPQLGSLTTQGYYPILPTSPVIDAGNPAAPGSGGATCEGVDQLGTFRPIDGNSDGTAICDIGAFETTPPAPSQPTTITIDSGSLQTAGLSEDYPLLLSAVVLDQYGVGVPGVIVTFTAPSSGASAIFSDSGTNITTATSNESGKAISSSLRANSIAGVYFITAVASGLDTPVNFRLENVLLVPTTLGMYSGSPQTVKINQVVQNPLKAIVRDQLGNPVEGVTVAFTAPEGGPSGIFSDSGTNTTTALTDSGGIAAASAFTANSIMGSYLVQATVLGIALPVDFQLGNLGDVSYVSANGNDTNDCFSPLTPCLSIQRAIDRAYSGDTIRVTTGSYTGIGTNPIVTIEKNVIISGGWDPTFTNQIGFSTVDCQTASRRGISVSTGIITSVENFIIQNAYLSGGSSGAGITNAGNLTLNKSAVINNYTDTKGGGIDNFLASSVLTLNESTVSGNYAATGGGGINSNGTVILNNSTISGNSSPSYVYGGNGGGIWTSGTAEFNNSTISNNTAWYGGGIHVHVGSVTLHNTIVSGNTSLGGPTAEDCHGHITSRGYNLIGNTTGCTFVSAIGDKLNIEPMLGPLVGLPGYHPLHPSSPAVDAGNGCPAIDQRFASRPFGSFCDMGAYEYSTPGVAEYLEIVNGDYQRTAPLYNFTDPLQVVILDDMGSPVPGATVTFTAPLVGASATFMDTGTNIDIAITDLWGIASSSTVTGNQLFGAYTVNATSGSVADSEEFHLTNVAWYVTTRPSGNDSNSCSSPADPCLTINAAMNKGSFYAGDFIFVGQGYYRGESGFSSVVVLSNSVNLIGGWDSTFQNQIGFSTVDGENVRRGLYIDNYDITIDHFVIENGYTEEYGGGIRSIGNVTLTNTFIQNNIALVAGGGRGGGISNFGQMIIEQSAVFNNSAVYGGGIHNTGQLSISNSTIAGNQSWHPTQALGGGIYTYTGSLSLNNVTIIGNSSSYGGGGIYGSFTLENSILSGNTAQFGLNCIGPLNSNGYNIIGDTSSCTMNLGTNDQTNTDPLVTFLPSGFTPLLFRSPAIDLANPDTCTAFDQAGNARTIDGDNDGHAVCDIGASELNGNGTTPGYLAGYPTYHYILPSSLDPNEFLVYVWDAFGNGVPGVTATLTAPESGPSGIFSNSGTRTITIDTDGFGIGAAGPFTANSVLGTYQVEVSITELPSSVFFDVTNGISIRTYTNQNNLDDFLPGVLLCSEADPLCTDGADLHADFAHLYAMQTYSFYLEHHGRNSIDNASMAIVSSVHYGTGYNNAFWNGEQMVYGDGQNYPSADDVVAHELTHGVTDYTSRLFYYYQSGAINESFSDLWGEFLDQTNGEGNDAPFAKWLIGEEIGAIRNMANPPQFLDPDKMTSYYYHQGDMEDLLSVSFDNGGVHTNSGVNNKAVYLMTDGGTFNGYTISGLGLNKVAAIYYEAQVHLLTSGADYKDLYYALHQACINVINGPEGVTLADCSEVQKTLDAVEMNLSPVSNFNPEAQLCSAGETPVNLFFEDFESSSGSWSLGGSGDSQWERITGYEPHGEYSLYGPDPDSVADTSATMISPVNIPATGTTYLHFYHSFGFEFNPDESYTFQTWDGGVLEYSIDGGAWIDAQPLFNSGQNYNGSVYAGGASQNPLAGRNAFVRDSHGFVSSRYILNTAAIKAHAVRFRWRIGADQFVGDLGWNLDDVRIYTCTPSYPGSIIFSDDFTTDAGWTNDTGGMVFRDAINQRLNWTAHQNTPLHFTIPIHATNNPIQLAFRFKVNSTSDEALLWAGLAYNLDDHSPGVAGADLAGVFVGIDSESKIQFLSLYPDLSYTHIDGVSSTLSYEGNSVWRQAVLTVNNLDWSILIRDDNGTEIGYMAGTLPQSHDLYDYLVLMYDIGGGTGSESGYIDDIYIYGTSSLPPNPVPISPSGMLDGESHPTFEWSKYSKATSYRLAVYSLDTSSYLILDTVATSYCDTSQCSYPSPINLTNGDYKFKVLAYYAGGVTPYSDWMEFTITNIPIYPNPLEPTGTISGIMQPDFTWSAYPGATSYYLAVYSNSAAAYLIMDTVATSYCNSSQCTYPSPVNMANGTYKWKVLANLSGGARTPFSPFTNFSITGVTLPVPPYPPTPLSPSSTVTTTHRPTFQWSQVPNAVFYRLGVLHIPTNTYTILLNVYPTCSGGVCSYSHPTIDLVNGNYRFKVLARNASGMTAYSSWMNFSVNCNLPVAPVLVAPSGTTSTNKPTFQWKPVSGATRYRLAVYSLGTSSYPILTYVYPSACTSTLCSYTTTTALASDDYKFKMLTYNTYGASGYTDWMSFSVP